VRPVRLYNRLEQNKQLTNKKGLFINMRRYYEMLGQEPFTVLPLTFHTRQGINDPDFKKFEKYYNSMDAKIKQK
jgi:tubulin monoglycylase TTLL3/8